MYNVGDVLYTTLPESGRIIPIQVVEVVNIKSISGEKTSYKVMIPSNKNKTTNLDKFNKVFTDLKKIEDYLLNNAKNAIARMIEEASDLNEKYFASNDIDEKPAKEDLDESAVESIECKNEDVYVKIDLGNGQIGKIKPDFIPKEI